MRASILILFLFPLASHALFVNSLTSAFQQVANTLTNAAQTAAGHVTNIATAALGHATNAWNGLTGGVQNVVGNVVDSAGNIYGQVVSTINGIQFVSNFLWDNVFGPSLDMLLENGAVFVDDKFGNILNGIGRRSADELTDKYLQLASRFKANIHHLYEQLFQLEKDALSTLQQGTNNLRDTLKAFEDKLKAIQTQVQQWANELKAELNIHAQTIEGDVKEMVLKYSKNVDITVETMKNLFKNLAQDLMKNVVEVALTVLPGAVSIVQEIKDEGLLSFLHG